MALEITIPALLANAGLNYYNRAQLGATVPTEMPASAAYDALTNAAGARAAAIAPDAQPLIVARREYVPTKGDKVDTVRAAGHTRRSAKDGRDVSLININPNVDASYYAHELGHGVSQKTKAGAFINNARHVINNNPKLGRALGIALAGAVPAVGAALQEGDDDLAGSIGLAAAMAAPELIDEALASKNALAIMKGAGMPATAGQRGRLAGAYLSYLAPVIISGSVGNALGNVADDYTALYDL